MADEITLENSIDDTLLTVVRRHLGYTVDDDELDARLTGYIRDGQAYLARLAHGQLLTWEEGTAERRLLLDYVFYANAKQTALFGEAYLADLTAFQLDMAVREANDGA